MSRNEKTGTEDKHRFRDEGNPAERRAAGPGSGPWWTGFGAAAACIGAALANAACPTYDESMDGGGDETGAPMQSDGHSVRCCYAGQFDTLVASTELIFCLDSIPRPCIDQGDYSDDDDLVEFCDMKCEIPWAVSTVPSPSGQYYDENFDLIPGTGETTWLDSCFALLANSPVHSTIAEQNVCNPSDPAPFGDGIDVPPTHGGFFSDRDGSMDIDIAGAALTAEYELSMHFALDDCQGGGIDGGTCRLVMSGFDMSLHDIELSGGVVDYQVTAGLTLNRTAVATVFFDECGLSTCEGSFEFSAAEENAIGVNLEWTQVNPTTMSTGHGELYLANDGVALGGLDPLYGFVQLDPQGEQGIIHLFGSGEDSLGGDLATVDFDAYGFVEEIDTSPGDCCAAQVTAGCSNDYIKACVATRIPSCYTTEWASQCVTAVELYDCGVCP